MQKNVEVEVTIDASKNIPAYANGVLTGRFTVTVEVDGNSVDFQSLACFVSFLKSVGLFESFLEESKDAIDTLEEDFYDSVYFDELPDSEEGAKEPFEIWYASVNFISFNYDIETKVEAGKMTERWESTMRDLYNRV